jgi:LemA protein
MPIVLLILLGFLVIIVVVALAIVGVYNTLVTLRNQFRNGFSQVDVQLKRRHDLIPNLVETAKGYMAHERGTLEAVINARAKATQASVQLSANPNDPNAIRNVIQAESGLSGALGRLMVVSENYPQLKADVTMKQLMDELASTENRIAFARQGYNDGVLQYNNAREVFPNVFVANMFGFAAAEFFKVESEEERAAPKVSF